VRSCIDQLSAGERALITLYYMNESTVKEITHITGNTESNVKIKLFRIRNKLRGMIKYNLRDKITVDYEE
jgi:RNA polymerase sigma-70 factor (ECF subfamily)